MRAGASAVLAVVTLVACAQQSTATCDFHPTSKPVAVGTTQIVKVGLDGLRFVDFDGTVWSAKTPSSTLPPIGTDVEVTLLSEASGFSGSARAQLADGTTLDLGVPGCG